MSQLKVLLLEFGLVARLGETLANILREYSGLCSVVRHELLAPIENTDDLNLRLPGLLAEADPGIIFLIQDSPPYDSSQLALQIIQRASVNVPQVVVTETGEPAAMMTLLELGATDFFTAPLTPLSVIPRLWRLISHEQHRFSLADTLKEQIGLKQIIGDSTALRAVVQKLPLIARCDANTLITGETGTGKEMCARAIHYLSARSSHAFVPVNCGAIPQELMENELFGHERGAFTDASGAKEGLVAEADGGTLFLDEIDSLPLQAQVKLLRFLQEKEFRPLGSAKSRKADVRIIAASNIDFQDAVETFKLRQDLYYRINVLRLHLPPLRARREDIPVLSEHFLKKYSSVFNKLVTRFSDEAIHLLTFANWPGNVRELEHIIERAVALATHPVIQTADLDLPQTSKELLLTFREAKIKMVQQFENAYVKDMLRLYHGNISQAARAARKDRRSFWGLIRKYGINPDLFR
ncbi:MAG: sigma 54-interacting transcriptional regulator [Blastocatellales bacterium]